MVFSSFGLMRIWNYLSILQIVQSNDIDSLCATTFSCIKTVFLSILFIVHCLFFFTPFLHADNLFIPFILYFRLSFPVNLSSISLSSPRSLFTNQNHFGLIGKILLICNSRFSFVKVCRCGQCPTLDYFSLCIVFIPQLLCTSVCVRGPRRIKWFVLGCNCQDD